MPLLEDPVPVVLHLAFGCGDDAGRLAGGSLYNGAEEGFFKAVKGDHPRIVGRDTDEGLAGFQRIGARVGFTYEDPGATLHPVQQTVIISVTVPLACLESIFTRHPNMVSINMFTVS